jgi:eukaryotic-like serine/threonine-protein kinase
MIGQRLAHYRILEKIGSGGMGQVYRVQDEVLRRTVAIKILPNEIASHAERRARILAEARAAAALNHHSITTIYEVGEGIGAIHERMHTLGEHPRTSRKKCAGEISTP